MKDNNINNNTLDLTQGRVQAELAGGFYGTPEDASQASPFLAPFARPQEQIYSDSQIARAAFERENEVVSSIAKLKSNFQFTDEIDPNFDIADYLMDEIDQTPIAPYWENFKDIKNRNNAELLKKDLERQLNNEEILASSGWKGIAYGVGAGLLSPINLIPFGTAYKAYKAGKIAKSAVITATAGGTSVALSESALQATQETRTTEESLINIAGGTILGGVLGGASALLSKKKFNSLVKKVEKDIQTETADVQINPITQNLEIKKGSQLEQNKIELDQVKKYYNEIYLTETKKQNIEPLPFRDFAKQNQSLISTITQDIAGIVKAEKLTKKINVINNLNPINRLTQTQYGLKPRSFAEKLINTGLYWNKNAQGIASYQSAEISKKRLQASYYYHYKPLENQAYKNFKQRIKKEGFANEIEAGIKNDIQFFEEVARSLRNGDISPVPEIQKLAEVSRKEIFAKLGTEAQDVGLLNSDINVQPTAIKDSVDNLMKSGQSYFPRLYNRNKIVARELQLRELLKNGLKNKVVPQIKAVEAKKELNLNSQILDIRTKQAKLQDALDKADQEIVIKGKDQKIELPKEIESDSIIPNEYRKDFIDLINFAKGKEYDIDQFNDLINQEIERGALPENIELGQEDIEKMYNKYVSGNDLIYTTNELNSFLTLLKDAYKSIKENKPKSLLQFIKERGGIIDETGELRAMGITNKNYPFLIRKKSLKDQGQLLKDGKNTSYKFQLDYVREAVDEAGYFAEHKIGEQTSTINDLFDLIEREVRGEKIYTQMDIDKAVLYENAQRTINEIESLGLNINEIKTILKQKKGKPKFEIVDGQETRIELKKLAKLNKALAKEELRMLDAKAIRLTKKYNDNQSKYKEIFGDPELENNYLENVVSEIVAKMKGEERLGYIDDKFIKISARGPLKERTLNFLSDNELEPFLENDARKVINYYQDTLSSDIEIARAFDGDLTLQNAMDEIYQEYDEIAKTIKDPAELKKLDKEKRSVINDIDSLGKIMRGVYKTPKNPDDLLVRGGRLARTYNYITRMGMVVLSSASDIAMPIAKHGLKTWAKTLPNLILDLKGAKLNVKEAKLAGNIRDIVQPERMASLSGLNEPFSNTSTFEKFVDNISKTMSQVNLMPMWNDMQKGFSGILSQQRMIDIIRNYNSANPNDITYLAKIGIGKDNYNIVLDQIKKHSYKDNKFWIANTEKWDNQTAVRLYQNALNLDIDSTIVTPGAGDLPLWARTETGKVILQFRTFAFASTQQVLLANLQKKDMAVLSGLIAATSMGMFSYWIRKKIAGKEPSSDPNVWLMEGLDRSAFLGIISEYSHIADKAGIGFAGLTGLEQSSRYAARSAGASLLGPSVSLVSDGFTATRALTSNEISPSDAKAVRRMIPLNNHWALTSAMDKFEENLTNTE